MHNFYNQYPSYPYSYYLNMPMYNLYNMYRACGGHQCPYCMNPQMFEPDFPEEFTKFKDYGPEPFVINIEEATTENNTYRTALWTGENLQVTLMSIEPGEDIGLEVHPEGDQFIRIEEGEGLVRMGDSKDKLDYEKRVYDDFAIMIPAGKWHNVINTGDIPLKLYAIYAPPEHPRDTVHETKEDAEAAEEY